MAAMGRIPDRLKDPNRLKENEFNLRVISHDYIVPVLFLGICLNFHFFSGRLSAPKLWFSLCWCAVAKALTEP